MLEPLRRIVQSVSAASTLEEALTTIVSSVREAMSVDVCSVYLSDALDASLELKATQGLNQAAVGGVRLALGEGLVGLAGVRQEPVNLDDAASHPAYRYFPETGEERVHGFLGVPIIHFRNLLGVLVVQQTSTRRFDQDEVAFLVTVAAQLAGVIAHTRVTDETVSTLARRASRTGFLQGTKGSAGVAVARVALLRPMADLDTVPDRPVDDVEAEVDAFRQAVASLQADLKVSSMRMAGKLAGDTASLFDVYIMLLGSESLTSGIVKRIRKGQWAPAALRDTIAEHARVFEDMQDEYLRGRSDDIRDMGQRLLALLQSDVAPPRDFPQRCILVGDRLSASQIAEVPVECIAGIVSTGGTAASHVAVLAHALGIPAVMGLDNLPMGKLDGREMVVDGYLGRVYIEPSPAVRREFRRLEQEERAMAAELAPLRDKPARTRDDVAFALHVNTGLLSDIGPSLECGAEGVGLYRTELPFMIRQSFPGEDEQVRVYRQVLESFAPRPVTMRTLDIGGDKPLPYFPIREDNPFLGWRGIRFTLDHPEIFLVQLRAMLRAAAGLGNLRILLPMVSRVGELDEAEALLDRAFAELREEGYKDLTRPPVGVMIEVPSMVYQAGLLARRSDFLSVGTNDLAQYLLAVDRTNSRVANLYDELHPAVLRAVRVVVGEAHRWHKPVSICGEMAGNPASVILLAGMGIDMLSMSAFSLPRSKWVIRSMTHRRARTLLRRALTLPNPEQIRAMLDNELENMGLGGLIRCGR